MMVSKKETRSIYRFVCCQLRDEPDPSTLTIGILKKRYLALVGCQSLSPEAKHFMKQVVLEELMKMQDIDKNDSEPEAKKLHKKRKREKKNYEVTSEEDESTAKKSCYRSGSSSDLEDDVDGKTGGMESQEEDKSGSEDEEQEQEVKISKRKTNGNSKHQTSSEDSADEELKDAEKDEEESNCGDSPEKIEARSSSTDQEKNTPQSNEENDSDTDNKKERSDKISDDSSADDSETDGEEKKLRIRSQKCPLKNLQILIKTGGMESQEEDKSGSEDEKQKQEVKNSKRKTNGNSKHQTSSEDSADEELKDVEKDEEESNCGDSPEKIEARSSSTDQEKNTPQSNEENDSDTDNKKERSDDSSADDSKTDSEEKKLRIRCEKDDKIKAIVRLKHYIALCGVRRNYKKLLDGCRSVGAKVAVLKKELENLGVHGRPSIRKCERARKKREEAQEVAELDVNNIIVSQGRPRRTAAWQEQPEPRSATYVRTLSSGSDSAGEDDTHQGPRRTANWANLRGIISDDADSD